MDNKIAEYLYHLTEIGRHSPATIKSYETGLKKWEKYNGDTRGYKKWLKEQGLAKGTINLYLVALRLYGDWAKSKNYNFGINRDDIVLSKIYQNLSLKFLTKKEMVELFNYCEGIRDRAIISTLFTTGLRVGELVKLKASDLPDPPPLRLEIPIVGKGGKQRVVYLTLKIQKLCKDLIDRHGKDRIFPYSVRYIQQRVSDVGRRALDRRVTPHHLRHTFATHLLEEGVSTAYIQKFLGHSSLSSTQIYLTVRNRKLKLIHTKIFD